MVLCCHTYVVIDICCRTINVINHFFCRMCLEEVVIKIASTLICRGIEGYGVLEITSWLIATKNQTKWAVTDKTHTHTKTVIVLKIEPKNVSKLLQKMLRNTHARVLQITTQHVTSKAMNKRTQSPKFTDRPKGSFWFTSVYAGTCFESHLVKMRLCNQ